MAQARVQRFPRNLVWVAGGILFVLIGGGLLWTAAKNELAAEAPPATAAEIRPGQPENVTARAREQAGGLVPAEEVALDPAAPELPMTPGASMPPLPVPRLAAGSEYRMPAGTPAAPPDPMMAAQAGTDLDAYAAAKGAAQAATGSIAAYESFDGEGKSALPAPAADALSMVNQALAGMVPPAGAGDATSALLQRALQAGQTAGGAAKAQSAWVNEQKVVTEAEPPLTATAAPSPWMLFQGTVIPAVLVTPVTSDAPGAITARVTRDVWDDVNARHLLIPKGSRLYGAYQNEVSEGQERILMAFTRLIFPDGRSVRLSGFGGADAMGRAGAPAEVNHHFWSMFGASFLIAGVSKIFDRSSQTQVTVINQAGGSTTLSDSAGQILTDTARKILEKRQTISPTLNLREGFKFVVVVNRDMALTPAGASREGYANKVLSSGRTSAAMTRPTIHLMTSNSRSILWMSLLVARFSAERASAALRATSSAMPAERNASYTTEIINAMSALHSLTERGGFYA